VCIAKDWNIQSENVRITNIKGFHTAQDLSSKNVTKLIVQGQVMHYFPNNLMKVFPSLSNVEVTSSKLKKISKFVGKKLTSIKITGNEINDIESDSFAESSKSLTFVDISNNMITKIPDSLFFKCFILDEVNFQNNKLVAFNWNQFAMSTLLRKVYLGHNKIRQIDWKELSSIELIDLQGNECIDMSYSDKTKDAFLDAIVMKCGTEVVLKCKFKNVGGSKLWSSRPSSDQKK
jgi:Leucine-rich repeat (LRR) protein